VIEWFAIHWEWYGVAAAALALEYAYALLLTRSPAPDARARGYSLIFEALEGFLHGVLLLAAIAALEGAVLAGARIVPPQQAASAWDNAMGRLTDYLLGYALFERDLAITVILSPLAGTVAASSMLARYAAQFLLYYCAAMLFLTQVLMSYGSLMVSVGVALTSVRRVRSLGPYLVFSVLGIAALSGGLAPYVERSLQQLKYSYHSGLDLFKEVGGTVWGTTINNILDDGRLLAQTATVVAVASGVVVAVSAAASRAAGGLAETLAARIRGL
jgi:hypothetical protein